MYNCKTYFEVQRGCEAGENVQRRIKIMSGEEEQSREREEGIENENNIAQDKEAEQKSFTRVKKCLMALGSVLWSLMPGPPQRFLCEMHLCWQRWKLQ